MKKKYIKPTVKLLPTFYGDDVMQPILKHSYDWVGTKERDAEEDDNGEIGERPNEYG